MEPHTHEKVVEFINDEHDYPIYRVTASGISKSTVTLTVESIDGWDSSETKTPVGFDPMLSVFVKWDSCSHWTFENSVHICGVGDWRQFSQLVRQLHDIAFRLMGRAPEEPWEA